MSDEPKKRSQWTLLSWPLPIALATMAAYQGAHYATAAVAYYPGACAGSCTHMIGGKEVPEWIDNLFWLANRIDGMIGVDPYREPGR